VKPLSDKLLGGLLVALIAIAVVGGLLDAVRGARDGDAEGLLAQGAAAPAFSAVRHADGKAVTSADFKGKVVVLDFWGTWCPHCVNEAPRISEVAVHYAASGVVVLALDEAYEGGPEPRAEVAQFLKTNRLDDYPVAYPSSNVVSDYQVRAFPSLYVIGKDGKVSFRGAGEISETRLRQAIDTALSG
jgi:thiol-disulfide isomerase/thioredoxin